MYALVIDNQIQSAPIYVLPRGARRLDTGEWVTPNDRGWTPELAEPCGYYEVIKEVRPDDTADTKYESVYTWTGSTVTRTWNAVPKTAEEIATDTTQANEALILSRAANAIQTNRDFLDLASPTNAQTLSQVKDLTRQVNGLLKLKVRDLDSAD